MKTVIRPCDEWRKQVMYENELPDMSDAEYAAWYAASQLIDGVRVGPRVASSAQADNATPTQESAPFDEDEYCWVHDLDMEARG